MSWSVSMNPQRSLSASIRPTVLLPEPGMPTSTMFDLVLLLLFKRRCQPFRDRWIPQARQVRTLANAVKSLPDYCGEQNDLSILQPLPPYFWHSSRAFTLADCADDAHCAPHAASFRPESGLMARLAHAS